MKLPHRLPLLTEFVNEIGSPYVPHSSMGEEHKEILKQLGYPNAKQLERGEEGMAYRDGNKVIKIALRQNFNDTFSKIDKFVQSKNYKHILKPIDIGNINGYNYSIKDYLNPVPDKIKKELDDFVNANLDPAKDDYPTADTIDRALYGEKHLPKTGIMKIFGPLFDEAWEINTKFGLEPDLGFRNMGVDSSGTIKVFDP